MHNVIVPRSFVTVDLENRLGQTVSLAVRHVQAFGKHILFVSALTQQASSVVAKNAQHFALQLREKLAIDPRRFDMIELRGDHAVPSLWRWRFEWVGSSPFSGRCEAIQSEHHHSQLLNLLHGNSEPVTASA